jgi:hypothetical protein
MVTGQGCKTLVLQSINAYSQFRSESGEQSVIWEFVSNNFLPSDQPLTSASIEALHAQGFEGPVAAVLATAFRAPETAREITRGGPATSPNFFRYVDLVSGETLQDLAGRTLTLLSNAYGRSPLQRVDLEMTLGDGCVASKVGSGLLHEAVQ